MPGAGGATVRLVIGSPEAEARLARAAQRLPDALGRLVTEVAGRLTRRALERTPVRTGRARAAWVSALEQLAQPVPTGWQGAEPEADAIAEGRRAGIVEGRLEGHRQEIEITNGVPYTVLLELGSRSRPGKHMVRRSMLEVREQVRSLMRAMLNEILT